MSFPEWATLIGSIAFGLVIGWITGGILRRSKRDGLTDIATVIGALGGAAIIGLFSRESGAFGVYCVGLAIGFFLYIYVATRPNAQPWLGDDPGARRVDGAVDSSITGKLPD